MDTLYKNVIFNSIVSLCNEKVPKVSPSKMCTDLQISRSLITKLKDNPNRSINGDTAQKIADYFGVSVDRVLGKEQKESPTGQMVDEANIENLLDQMSQADLLELMGKVAEKLRERGLE